jgi:hypothetical protein
LIKAVPTNHFVNFRTPAVAAPDTHGRARLRVRQQQPGDEAMTKLNVSRNLAGAATVAAITIAAPECASPGAESAAAWGPRPRPRPKKWSASTVTAVVFALVGSATSMSSPRRHRPVSTSGPAGPGAHLPGSRLLTSLQCRSCDPSAPPADGSFCRRLTQSDKASLRESLPKCATAV